MHCPPQNIIPQYFIIIQQADFGIGALSLTNERAKAVSYSYPHIINAITFLTCKPDKLGYSSSLTKPFEYQIWLTLFSLLVLTSIMIKILKVNKTNALTLVKIVFGQSANVFAPKKIYTLIILSSWILSSIILKIFYCAKLWDFMTFDQSSPPIETIGDLIQSMKKRNIKMIIEYQMSIWNSHIQVN